MSEAREFTAYVVLRDPNEHQTVTFAPGDVVPEWALDVAGDHVTQGVTRSVKTAEEAPDDDAAGDHDEDAADDEESEELPPYEEWSKTDLRAEVDGRELDVNKKATVAELVEALQADDLVAAAEEAE